MIRGETVYVSQLVPGAVDRLGNPTDVHSAPKRVDNVVVVPSTDDEVDATRPDGIRVIYTLHFPRGYGQNLRGAIVTVRGDELRVIGDPKPYTEANVPGPWTMPVKVGRHDG